MAMHDRDTAFNQFESLGVDHVRLEYGGPPPEGAAISRKMIYSWAKEWLATFDKDDRLASLENSKEARRMARSAKNAAWAAAIAAIVAAVAAIASAVIAFSQNPS